MTATVHALVWLRNDLRLADNPALHTACRREGSVVPVFVLPDEAHDLVPGDTSRWWLGESLEELAGRLRERGAGLVVRSGDPAEQLAQLVGETEAGRVYFNRRIPSAALEREQKVSERLAQLEVEPVSSPAALMFETDPVRTQQGTPYKVFTPFWRACRERGERIEPVSSPEEIPTPDSLPDSLGLEELRLPESPAAGQAPAFWSPGETAAQRRLDSYISEDLDNYPEVRDRIDLDRTSRLSVHLARGELTPRQVLAAVLESRRAREIDGLSGAAWEFVRQLGWREFSYYVLHHFPHTLDRAMKDKFLDFPWRDSDAEFSRWQRGETGYPLVDAAMRCLEQTGWMHNRARMIVASFLTKDLLIHWRRGAGHFEARLADADLANNTMGWQWTAGTGADAAPYFRVFNPVTQSEDYDPDGEFIREWVPELRDVSTPNIHSPFPGGGPDSYPGPVVDHAEARERALAAYEKVK